VRHPAGTVAAAHWADLVSHLLMHLVAQLLGLAGHLVAPLTHLFGVVHPTKLFPGRCVVRLCLSHRGTRDQQGRLPSREPSVVSP
jgi:hypothetical protein